MNNHTKRRGIALTVFLVGVNILAWIWAFCVFHHHAVMLSAALLAYSFGLRHAVDADHIAAIDTVTRKLMQQGKTPLGVGAFFSLGHSTIVVLACLAIVVTSMAFRDRIDVLHQYGSLIGTAVSAFFYWRWRCLTCLFCSTYGGNFARLRAANQWGRMTRRYQAG